MTIDYEELMRSAKAWREQPEPWSQFQPGRIVGLSYKDWPFTGGCILRVVAVNGRQITLEPYPE